MAVAARYLLLWFVHARVVVTDSRSSTGSWQPRVDEGGCKGHGAACQIEGTYQARWVSRL